MTTKTQRRQQKRKSKSGKKKSARKWPLEFLEAPAAAANLDVLRMPKSPDDCPAHMIQPRIDAFHAFRKDFPNVKILPNPEDHLAWYYPNPPFADGVYKLGMIVFIESTGRKMIGSVDVASAVKP